MNEYEITFGSANTRHYSKRITAFVTEPDAIDANTGLMHFAHGWGGNRYAYRDMQREFVNRYNLIGVAAEYRQSGYDFDPVTGMGYDIPYDTSHFQVFDCLNAVRKALALHPNVNKRRLMAFGGSQGGQIALLMCIFCPHTFAVAIAGSPLTHMDAERCEWACRDFSADESAIRDVVAMAPRIQCPVVLMHGTADNLLPDYHTRLLEASLRKAGKEFRVKYYEGGGHGLEPVSDRKTASMELADDWLKTRTTPGPTDFERRQQVMIPCVAKALIIDWSKSFEDHELIHWEPIGRK